MKGGNFIFVFIKTNKQAHPERFSTLAPHEQKYSFCLVIKLILTDRLYSTNAKDGEKWLVCEKMFFLSCRLQNFQRKSLCMI